MLMRRNFEIFDVEARQGHEATLRKPQAGKFPARLQRVRDIPWRRSQACVISQVQVEHPMRIVLAPDSYKVP